MEKLGLWVKAQKYLSLFLHIEFIGFMFTLKHSAMLQ